MNVGHGDREAPPLPEEGPRETRGVRPPLALDARAAERMREEIERAGGREVCFLAEVTSGGIVHAPRVVARGNRGAVLAAASEAPAGALMIHNHPSGTLAPSDADLEVAARLYESGLGSAITDNAASALYVVVEPPTPRVRIPLDADVEEAILAPGGALSRLHPRFEDREGQRTFLRGVVDVYNEGGILLVEAGTGIGKSLAYLLPAARWALRNGERTVISTATINLQSQLAMKDLPLVRRILKEEGEEGELRWALLKGRGNYISIRRAELARESQSSLFSRDHSDELTALLDWTETTRDGSLSDLPFTPSDELWDEVRSDSDVCLRARCPHFQRCFFQKARREAASADLLVANHSLLFADLSLRAASGNWSRSAVLPPFRRIILDEAHNVEDVATSHLGARVTRSGLFRMLSRLERGGRGLLASIETEIRRSGERDPNRLPLLQRLDQRVHPALGAARGALERFIDLLEPLVPDREGGPLRFGAPQGGIEPWDDPECHEAAESFLAALTRLERELQELRTRIGLAEGWAERFEGRILDLQGTERRLAESAIGLRRVLIPEEGRKAPYVRWMEGTRSRTGRANLLLSAAPLHPGGLLREALFEPARTVVLASATLTTGGDFTFLRERLGLADPTPEDPALLLGDSESPDPLPPITELLLPSPFDYRARTILAVPTDLPLPGDPRFDAASAEIIARFAEVTAGGIFALFTSHGALRTVASRLRGRPGAGTFPLFVHGEEDRARLLGDFMASGSGILLGTASFWEGVDVPGEALRGLVIQKLPFRVPTEPVTQARVEAIEAEGRDAFTAFSLPLAALRLRQGFGRLVRSATDRGGVLILDERLVTRRYGRVLRAGLPPSPLHRGGTEEILDRLRTFYHPGQTPPGARERLLSTPHGQPVGSAQSSSFRREPS